MLTVSSEKRPLKLLEDLKKGVVCQGLEEFLVQNTNDLMELFRRGIQLRQTATTLKNQNSSRSHSIFTFKISVKENLGGGEQIIRHGVLNLVDLAG